MHIGSFRAGGAGAVGSGVALNEPDFCGHQSIRHSGARTYLVITNNRQDASAHHGFSDTYATTFRTDSLTVEEGYNALTLMFKLRAPLSTRDLYRWNRHNFACVKNSKSLRQARGASHPR
jgi:hypothetical protein